MADEQIILKVSIDEGKTNDRLKQLTLELEANRAATRKLNEDRKANMVTDAEYAQQNVDLAREQRNLRSEQTALTKQLDLYTRAVNGVSGSYDQTQAQLSLAKKQFDQLSGSADNSSEEAQELTKVIDSLRNTLKQTDFQQSLFVRNVGNYGSAIEPLVQQLVKLREEEKGLAAGSKELAANQERQIGFQIAAQRAAAQAGKTFDEANTAIENYAKSIQPATAELVKLEQEQARLVQTGEATTETVQRIGFQMSKLEKELKDTADAAPALGEIGKQADKAEASLDDVAKVSGPLAPAIEKLSSAKEKYTAAVNLAKSATVAEIVSLGGLKVALIATGLGAFVVILGSLIAFLTKTQQGSDFLSRKLGALGAVVTKLTSYVVDFGGKLFEAFENPKQALSDLVDFIGQNLLNRLTSVGVLIDGIRNGDFSKIADSAIQFTTGIADGTSKLKAFGSELGKAADAGERIAQMEQEWQRATNDNIDTNKRLLNEVERLKNVRDNEFNSLAVRRKANEDAFRVEMQRENTLASLAQRRVDILRRRLELEGGRSRNEELFKELKEAENELADIREDAAGKQNELITNRYQLAKEGADAEKEAAEKAAEANRQQLQAAIGLLDVQLQAVRKNSDEELRILRQKLALQYQLELAAKGNTVGQRKLADAKYEAERTKLEVDSARSRAAEVLQVEVNNLAARLSAVAQAGAQELALQQEQIENTRRQQLQAIDRTLSDEAQAAQRRAINAAADRQQDDLLYADKLRKLQNYNQQERNEVERAHASLLITDKEYQDQLYQQQLAALTSQIALAKKFGRDTTDLDQQVTDLQIANMRRVTDERREEAQKLAEITAQLATLVGEFFAASVNDAGQALRDFSRQAILVLVQSVEKAILASQIEILARAFSKASSIETFGAEGGIRAAIIIAGLAAATAPLKAALTSDSKFEKGGVTAQPQGLINGPSHEQGGIQMWRGDGAHLGEMRGGETILVPGVWNSPLLRPMASVLNQLGGGRPLLAGRHHALGGIASSAVVREYLNNGSTPAIDYTALGEATAAALRKNPPVNRWSDFKDAEVRNTFTDTISSD